ncbi:hypothetical protein [Pseudomonas phage 71PfluR64PP]|uniref:Uncharacterized protein n=3 Tax=Pifdecavirus pv22PfluR64PP TaxID=2733656 RepID=A0A2S1PH04_9CAUD|nr:hypothetical protein HOT19_gp34 [Pseudomonas phage 22PfluR64PP]AWH14614.1 hypothetical protein [Pseudomonas phage 22PfluR64PP]AWH14745.1 hypothetical protein [Pseudomonas phage 71PfluR64PP]AWH15785.1 hypothetical protein [Pseudomonas phage 67PfluR64PP]
MSKFSTFNLIAGFNQVLAHLNSEENELAAQFAETLKEAQGDVYHLNNLQNRGVDNWDGYVGRGHEECEACGFDEDGCECGGDQ